MTIYQHFREHEHPFVDRVLDWMEQVKESYTVYVTDFLNPRECEIITSVIGNRNEEVIFSFSGGVEGAERKQAVIAPYFVEISEDDFDIVALEATYVDKFVSLTHRDVLGSFMSLGIDRKKIGDIIVRDGIVQIITTRQLSRYIIQHLLNIKHTKVTFKKIPLNQLEEIKQNWVNKHYTVSSLRLDVVVKELYRLSRKNALKLIESEKVSLNYAVETNQALQLTEGDLLSVRGYGRCKLIQINGKTRKEKIRLEAAHLM